MYLYQTVFDRKRKWQWVVFYLELRYFVEKSEGNREREKDVELRKCFLVSFIYPPTPSGWNFDMLSVNHSNVSP